MAVIRGTAREDTLRGTLNADQILALGGGDFVSAKAGDDLVDGGAGSDVLEGELGNDRLFGDDGFDSFTGGRGSDRVFGGAGDDSVSDFANGPDGNDVYDGGAGRDLVNFGRQTVGVRLTLAEGGADSRAFQGGEVDILRSIEEVFGSNGADVISGNSTANVIVGGSGDDRIFGRGGDDDLGGGETRGGTADYDVLVEGGAGNDDLTGGYGRLRLVGGTGADTLRASPEATTRGGGVDRNDLGSDAAGDTFDAVTLLDSGEFFAGFGVERVANVRAQDRLNVTLESFDGFILFPGEFLDGDDNGVVNDADRDARLVGGNLVLDFDQLFEREADLTVDLGEQHVILEGIARINADQFL